MKYEKKLQMKITKYSLLDAEVKGLETKQLIARL